MNKYPPECPFCGRHIVHPEKTMTEFGEVLSGKCNCGSVYVCDPTGRNVGEAYMEALAIAKGDWNIYELGEDEDYEIKEMGYNLKNHMQIHSAAMSEAKGKLIFVKLRRYRDSDIMQKKDSADTQKKTIAIKGRLKNKIKELLDTESYDEIADLAKTDKGVIRQIISLAYDKEDVMTWRAIEAIGFIAKALSVERIDVVRDTIRRLLWSMGEESGGIGWSSAEMLGEIIRANPDEFIDIIPILWSFRDEEMFRPGILWAMGRIALCRPDLAGFILKDLQVMTTDKNPTVRGYAAWFFGIIGAGEFVEDIKNLAGDNSSINFYQDGNLIKRTVGEIAEEAISRIRN